MGQIRSRRSRSRCSVPVKEDDKDDELTAARIGIPLRSCAHFCCKNCFLTVEGKVCPTCKASLPTISSLDKLPYIEQFGSSSDAVKHTLIEEFYMAKEADRTSTKEKGADLEEASAKASKAVEKHYRWASLKVHPDRFGETYRKEFDALTQDWHARARTA